MPRLVWCLTMLATVTFGPCAYACGDKLLVLGRAFRFSTLSSERPAAILAYSPQGSIVSEVLSQPQWITAMEKGKHRLKVVQDLDGFVTVLRSERYDLVLISLSDATQLRLRIQSVSSEALVVPVVSGSFSGEEVRAAQKEYPVALKIESKSKAYLSNISKAVEVHDRRAQFLAQGRKSGRAS